MPEQCPTVCATAVDESVIDVQLNAPPLRVGGDDGDRVNARFSVAMESWSRNLDKILLLYYCYYYCNKG